MTLGFLEREVIKNKTGLTDADIDWVLADQDSLHIIATIKAIWPRIARAAPKYMDLFLKVKEHLTEEQ